MIIVKYFFNVACFLTAFGMTAYWVFKYWKDEDLCQVDFKPFEEAPNGKYLTFSLCFSNVFVNQKLKNYSLTKQSYIEILKGHQSYNGSEKIDFNDLTIDLASFYLGDQIKFRNDKTILNGSFPMFLNALPRVTFSGFFESRFFKCFGLEMKYSHVDYAVFKFNKSAMLEEVGQDSDVFITPHLPNKLLMFKNDGKMWQNLDAKKESLLLLAMNHVEILKRRNKRTCPCHPDNVNFDLTLIDQHIEKVGCKAPYHYGRNDLKVCESKEKLKEFYDDPMTDLKLQVACTSAETIILELQEQKGNINGTDLLNIWIYYPDRFKEIKMVQAVDIHSAIGNSGGYIGLFLGKFCNFSIGDDITSKI